MQEGAIRLRQMLTEKADALFYCRLINISFNELIVPAQLELCRSNNDDVITTITLDAIDGMDFPLINLQQLHFSEKQRALEVLKIGLAKYGPAKGLAMVYSEDAELVANTLDYQFDPYYPAEEPGLSSIKKLQFMLSQQPQALEKFSRDDLEIQPILNKYNIMTNEAEIQQRNLTSLTPKLSELLIQHSGWVDPTIPAKRLYYEPLAMQLRLNNPNVKVYVLFAADNTNDPIGFARMHHVNNLYYFGDFVIHKDHRGKQLGKLLFNTVMRDVPEGKIITLIAGGSNQARAMYQKLGFISFTEHSQAGNKITFDKHVLMACNRKASNVLESFRNTLKEAHEKLLQQQQTPAHLLAASLSTVVSPKIKAAAAISPSIEFHHTPSHFHS
jgi:GNAT superfamily N-acetyltransferase